MRWLAVSIAFVGSPSLAPAAAPKEAIGDGLDPQTSQQCIRLPPGYRIELVAAEPAVESPVAVSFDEQGRMFVAEYRDYPSGPGPGKPPLSRIRLLEDVRHNGRFDKSTIFADKLNFAQGVLAWNGGVVVTAAPYIYFLKDVDGDGKADERRILFEGFKAGNPQLRAAHPKRSIDNWIYVSNGLSGGNVRLPGGKGSSLELGRHDFRFHSQTLTTEVASGFGQFGNAFDDWGRRFFCSNRNPIMHAFLPAEALAANRFAGIAEAYEDVAAAGAEAKVHPRIATMTTAFSHAGTYTAACGVHVFRGDRLAKDDLDAVFVCEPTAYLATRSRLIDRGSGFWAVRDREDADFFTSADPWCRPVSMADGPDGALYVVDMYREVIEHPDWMPKGMAEKLRLRAGADKGRIYRIVSESAAPARPYSSPKSTADCVALLHDPIGWRRDVGQRLLVERQAHDAEPFLRGLLADPQLQRGGRLQSLTRLHALWTLEGLGTLTAADVAGFLQSERQAGGLENGLQMAARFPKDGEIVRAILRLTEHGSARVRLFATLALGAVESFGVEFRLASLALRAQKDPWIARAVALSARERCAEVLKAMDAMETLDELAGVGRKSPVVEGEIVSLLATQIGVRGEPTGLKIALELIAGERTSPWWRLTLLTGLADGLARRGGPAGAISLASMLQRPPPDLSQVAPKIRTILETCRPLAADASRPAAERIAAIRLLTFQGDAAKTLLPLLGGAESAEIQLAVVQAVRDQTPDGVFDRLIAGWPNLSPTLQTETLEFCFRRVDTRNRLLDAMAAGKVPASALSAWRREELIRFSNNDALSRKAKALFGASAANREEVVVKYRPALKTKGDVVRGRAAFRKLCATCHRLEGFGAAVGPDLADVRLKPAETLLTDLLDPNRAVEPRFASYIAALDDGRVVTGLLVGETAQTVQLRRAEGQEEVIPRSHLTALQATGRSLMPEGLEKDLSQQGVADLLAYLKRTP